MTTMSRPSELQKEAWRSFLIAQARATREVDRRLRAAGKIPLDIYDVLVSLEYNPEHKLRMSELAETIVFSRSGLTRLIDRLVEKGYVQREPCEDDRRGSYAVLTQKGQAARLDAWTVFEPAIQEIWAQIVDDKKAAQLKTFFDEIARRSGSRLP